MNMRNAGLFCLTVVTFLGLSCPNTNAQTPVAVTITTVPAGLTISVDGTNYITPANFDWLSVSSHTLIAASPQTATDGHSRDVFTSWSDGGPQTNVISVPLSGTNYTANFATEYLLDLAVAPAGGGTVTPSPTGPWHPVGQLVSLTANTNSGYELASWSGVDTQSGNTAEVTMNGYRTVTATFGPAGHTYGSMYVSNSLVHFVIPKRLSNSIPIVAIPGLALSSYLYLTTPDGRKGWVDSFADAGFAFYAFNDPLLDFSGGFSVGPFTAPSEGQPPADPAATVSWVPGDIWPRWAFGPVMGTPYPEVRFPVSHFEAFTNAFPRRSTAPAGSGQYGANYVAPKLVALLERTGPAIVIAHSAAGRYATKAAQSRPDLVLGFVVIEALGLPAASDFPNFAGKHLLGISCDYVEEREITNRLTGTIECAALFKANGGQSEVIRLPDDLGINGNTHIVMQDNNNDFVAGLIIDWTKRHMLAPQINTATLTKLKDGKVQFGFTAPGSAQATVWGTTQLDPPNWQLIKTVTLTGGQGTFIDDDAPSHPNRRFYRVTLP